MMSTTDRKQVSSITIPPDMTVEQFLEHQCNQLVERVRNRANESIKQLRDDFAVQKQQFLDNIDRTPEASVDRVLPLTLKCSSGEYNGEVFHLMVSATTPCKVGRSGGRAFTTNGVSLKKDGEVSTTHGQFELDENGMVVFVDTGSTNGSIVNGDAVAENSPVVLKHGDKLVLGATTLIVKLE